MTMQRTEARSDAPALRFLCLCIGGWVALRVVTAWNPAVLPPDAAKLTRSTPSPFASNAPPFIGVPDGAASAETRHRGLSRFAIAAAPDDHPISAPGEAGQIADGGSLGGDRHSLRLALMARLLPPAPGGPARSAMMMGGPQWFPLAPASSADPGQGKPFWIRRQLAGWSLGGWLYLRGGSAAAPDAIAAAGQLGGSQAGLRVAYGLGEAGRLRAYGRATVAVRRPDQRELAFGLAFAPLAHLPVDVAVERRVAIGREGRTAMAAMVSGGVSNVALPAGFRLEAYGQAGIVGARRRDGFADGSIVVDRPLGRDETSPLRVGALAAGAVQPGAARVEVGPRLTLRLSEVGDGSRIALDWRQRVAGAARPESGPALTLATDF